MNVTSEARRHPSIVERGAMNERQPHRPPTTTDAGIPVGSQEHSLTVGPVGPDGPVLLQD